MPTTPTQVRFSQFNASLNRNAAGQLVSDLSTPNNAQAQNVAEIIQRTNPDVILINEFDYDASDPAAAVRLFIDNYLNVSQNGATPIDFPYFYIAPSNTGIASGFDLNNNGAVVTTPGAPGYGDDAFGFGNFPGQFGMLLLSKYPIDTANVRTFQNFLWKDMPDNLLTNDPTIDNPATAVNENLGGFYSAAEQAVLRLSSKSHWDVPLLIDGEIVHVLVSHPTPPVFDGPEDRNGKRNFDEIRFWRDYITPGQNGYIYDDKGNLGGLTPGSSFVIMGDQNADPFDGDSYNFAVRQLLNSPLINITNPPSSAGGPDAAARQGRANLTHQGNPLFDTADFADGTPGNLRADYVLPSVDLGIANSGVFWPVPSDPLFRLVGDFTPTLPGGFPSSDHRLIFSDVVLPGIDRKTVAGIDFLGEVTFPTGFQFQGTTVGGLSGITYDPFTNVYYSISDDRSQFNPARFYTLNINLSDGSLDNGDVTFTGVTTLTNASGQPFPALGIDPEGIALTRNGTLFITSEGDVNSNPQQAPFINEFSLTGQQLRSLPIASKFLPTPGNSGIRNNLAFESLTLTPNQQFLYSATENALKQDGPAASLTDESPARILLYDAKTGQPLKEFVYLTDPVVAPPVPAGTFSTNGLVELFAIDNTGTLLALERSFSNGVGNSIKLYQVQTQGAVDVKGLNSLAGLEADPAVSKKLLLDFADLGLTLDNIEGMTFGPRLADGKQSLIIVSDNNFSGTQFTQVLAFALDLDTIPGVAPTVETPPVVDIDPSDRREGDPRVGDADDPAIYVHPTDSSKSLVITTLKDGGLAVYDLSGRVVQTFLPGKAGDVRYNNVDLVYGFQLGNRKVDLAIASDRANDTLEIFEINPTTRQLRRITAGNIPASIFGIDDGERTAYGLTAYTSPVTGKSYVFVGQREGNQIAQLELVPVGKEQVTARIVRTLTVPIPPGGELEDAQTEGMVVDRERGILYVGQENFGIFKFSAEPWGSSTPVIVDTIDNGNLAADIEGLTLYYGADGKGYLLVSSQGDNTFNVYTRDGNNTFLGKFAIGPAGGIDSVEESDGADVINVSLGSQFPFGLLVVQDGNNDPGFIINDDGEIENASSNFKFIPWQNVANAFPNPLNIDPISYNPRNPVPTTLPNGIGSGDTTQTSTVLWARSTVLGQVTFEYSTDPNFGTILGSQTATVTDPLQPVKVNITGLTAGTDYYYRVTDGAGVTLGGDFNTAAASGTRAGLRFGVSGDWRGELSPYPAISNAIGRDLDFFVEHGDTVYADFESPILPGVSQATTLEEYRLKNSEVYGTRNGLNTWADLRRTTSILATIDDHEVINDFAGGAPAATDPRFGTTTGLINDTQLFDNGLQAFQEYNPIRDDFYGNTGDSRTAGERKLYRYNTYGSDAATFLLDTRSFRDAQLPGVADPTSPVQVGSFLAQSFDINPLTGQPLPRRTLLGQQQLDDLKRDLLEADNNGVTWKFIMVPEPIQNLGVVGASDRFEGYAAERTEILKFIDDNDIENVVFIAADIHGTVVNNLTYQTRPGGQQIATSAFEISTGSVAFDAPLGPTIAELAAAAGLINQQQVAFYNSLPVANDADSLLNDRDDFIKSLINQQVTALGYDPVGLNDNLAIANGLINARLLQGDYIASHTYGWTEFDINPATQKLRVTTYGIPFYTEAELLANPAAVLNRTPQIVSQFEVDPTPTINGTVGEDRLNGTDRTDRINGFAGDDTITPGRGDDRITGGGDNDTFVIRRGDGTDTITDFTGFGNANAPASPSEIDVLSFQGEGLVARNLLLTRQGGDLVVSFDGIANTQVVLKNVALEALENGNGSGNIRFTGDQSIRDSFDVISASAQLPEVLSANQVTFLNDLNNTTRGLNNSNDVINGQGGNDILSGLSGNDLLRGGAGNDTLLGDSGNDTLVGDDGNDILLGGFGDDILLGGTGNDQLEGGVGNDTLRGGAGNDILTGDSGRDIFVLALGEGVDTITDFSRREGDRIGLSGITFDDLTVSAGAAANTTVISANGQELAILLGIQSNNLNSSSFVTV